MANPQKESGHVEIANDVFEALIRANIHGRQMAVFLAIVRKTWGWGKKEDRVPLSQIVLMTGLGKREVCRMIKWLKDARMICRDQAGKTSVQKDYEKWVVAQEPVAQEPVAQEPVAYTTPTSGAGATSASGAGATLKRQYKNTIQKTIKKGRDQPFSAKEKSNLFLPNESQTMNEKIDESFPRKRRWGNEGMNWLLDYYEHKLDRKLTKPDAVQKRYLTHLKREPGYGKMREMIDWLAEPGCWWGDKVTGFDMIWYKRNVIIQQMERRPAKVEVGGELIEEREIKSYSQRT